MERPAPSRLVPLPLLLLGSLSLLAAGGRGAPGPRPRTRSPPGPRAPWKFAASDAPERALRPGGHRTVPRAAWNSGPRPLLPNLISGSAPVPSSLGGLALNLLSSKQIFLRVQAARSSADESSSKTARWALGDEKYSVLEVALERLKRRLQPLPSGAGVGWGREEPILLLNKLRQEDRGSKLFSYGSRKKRENRGTVQRLGSCPPLPCWATGVPSSRLVAQNHFPSTRNLEWTRDHLGCAFLSPKA